MSHDASAQRAATETFRALHESGCFVMPNPWDVGTAVFLERLGCQALATSSAGFAFTQAWPDDPNAIPLESALDHIAAVAGATRVPVNADFQAGYAEDPAGVADNVTRCIAAGVAGLSIEDATGAPDSPLFAADVALERVHAARGAIDASGIPVVLTARCEAYLVGHPDPLPTVLDRLTAFADAGADCLYAPDVEDLAAIEAIVRAVAPKPVNVLVSSANPALTVSRLADLGVRRISVGSALSRVAWGAFGRAAREMLEGGTFGAFADAAPFVELNDAFSD